MTHYPEEPWHLAGQMYLSLWLVPRSELPEVAHGTRPVRVAGRGVVGAAWVVYENDSVLHYNELLRAVLVRDGLRPRVCITDIWVDSAASMAGGRELWGIPKEMATFDVDRTAGVRAAARTAEDALADAVFEPGRRLPGRWPLSYRVAQTRHGRLKTSPVRSRSTVRTARARWAAHESGPLRELTRRPALLSLALNDFSIRFGHAARGPAE
ncbi:acetoacetate decarboxylase family protein [Streptomyces sp. NBC_00638]|uniref:acetoacetate decarboxylase family protein n=1 Tax=unclassified Streptomyces TaxID=2593676 RepID=UPI00225A5EFE|nr:acetoacetate decarboxylase family protein [Streptomyces sp. NBC_00638]MCX5009023.1 acetoacetate decarboxylase family protein [Streptomyces sp. NBC_00638]